MRDVINAELDLPLEADKAGFVKNDNIAWIATKAGVDWHLGAEVEHVRSVFQK